MLKILTNEEIYLINKQLNEVFENSGQYLPAKVNFYIQKNKKKIAELAQEIEESRVKIVINFGELSEENEGKYFIPNEKMGDFQKELNDLLDIEQEIEIKIISIEDIENLHFTFQQMESLMFMIEE